MPARRSRGRWSAVTVVLGVLVLVISAVWVVLVWYHHDAAAANSQASVLGFLLAVALAAVGLMGWVRRRRVAVGMLVTAEQRGQATATLAEVVAEQWAREAAARSLGEPMPVRWRLARIPVIDHPEVIAAAGLTFSGSSERISELVAAFRGLDRRRVVITGGAGTGKTTLAVQLLLELLAHPQPGEPVPVLLSLLGWDPQAQPRLQDWLTAQLERDYPMLRGFGDDTARALVERGKILPILDGLDEVAATLRPGIITALNDVALPAASGLILTSRRAEYVEAVAGAGDVLTAAAVIAPLALTRLEAASYLRKLLPPDPGTDWSTVLGQLETGTAADLATVTASPLGLWLVRTVYLDAHRDPTPLVQDTHPDRSAHPTLQAHLLDQLIPAVLHSRPPIPRRQSANPDVPLRPRRQYHPEDVRRWLTTLACELRAAGTRDWLWWHLARHTFPTTRTALTIRLAFMLVGGSVGVLLIGMVVGLVVGLAFGLENARVGGEVGVLAGVLVIGLAGTLVGVLVSGLTAEPASPDRWLRVQVAKLLRGLAFFLMGAALFVLVGGLANGPVDVLEVVLVGVLMGGLVVGLVAKLIKVKPSPSITRRASSPAESQHGDRRLTVLVTITTGLAVGLPVGLVAGLGAGLESGLPFGLWVGLGAGLGFALLGGVGEGLEKRAWPTFLVASGWLAIYHRFPWRLMAFLEDAHHLGLLRVAGSAYQFRHAELQDHLAP